MREHPDREGRRAAPGQPETIAEIAARLRVADPRPSGVVPGLLPPGLTVAYGASGSLKTFAAVAVAVRVASGREVGPYAVNVGGVAYLAFEDRRGVELRIIAALKALDIPLSVPIAVMAPTRQVYDKGFAAAVVTQLRERERAIGAPVRMVIIDTLGAGFDGESLNDDKPATTATGQLLSIAASLGDASILVVHHTGKDADRGERGSRVLRDRADATLKIAAAPGGTTLTVEKMRNGPSGFSLFLQADPYSFELPKGLAHSTLVIGDIKRPEDASAAASGPRLTRDGRIVLEALAGLGTGTKGDILKCPPDDSEWRSAAYTRFGSRSAGTLKKAFNRAKKSLIEQGFIACDVAAGQAGHSGTIGKNVPPETVGDMGQGQSGSYRTPENVPPVHNVSPNDSEVETGAGSKAGPAPDDAYLDHLETIPRATITQLRRSGGSMPESELVAEVGAALVEAGWIERGEETERLDEALAELARAELIEIEHDIAGDIVRLPLQAAGGRSRRPAPIAAE